MDNEVKPAWQSKTLWMALITAFAPMIPGGTDFLASYASEITCTLGTVFFILRLVTKQGVKAV